MTLKTKVAIVSVLVAAIAIIGAGVTRGAGAGTYEVSVDTIEGCSCPLFCTCYFGRSTPAHMCQANNVYKFRKGSHYGDVDLSNQLVWMTMDLGGEWHEKPGPGMPGAWAVVTFDKSSTPEQQKALEQVTRAVFPITWKEYETRQDSISWQDDAKTSHAKLASGLAEIQLDKTTGPDKQAPTVVKNLQYWWSASNDGFVLAYSTHQFNGKHKFSQEKKNGFNIAWTAKGDIKPDAPKTAAK
jgi:hypothetical protein